MTQHAYSVLAEATLSGIPITATACLAQLDAEGEALLFVRNTGATALTFTVYVYPDGTNAHQLAQVTPDLDSIPAGESRLVALPTLRPWELSVTVLSGAPGGGACVAQVVQPTIRRARTKLGR